MGMNNIRSMLVYLIYYSASVPKSWSRAGLSRQHRRHFRSIRRAGRFATWNFQAELPGHTAVHSVGLVEVGLAELQVSDGDRTDAITCCSSVSAAVTVCLDGQISGLLLA